MLLLENRILFPNSSKNFNSNKKFDSNKYNIILYLTKDFLYNILPALIISSNNFISKLNILSTKSIVN
jgi:hypothetical protein